MELLKLVVNSHDIAILLFGLLAEVAGKKLIYLNSLNVETFLRL